MQAGCRRRSMSVMAGVARVVVACLVGIFGFAPALGGREFIRGDSNLDGRINLPDALFTLEFKFRGGPAPGCMAAADANDDEALDLTDAIRTLRFLFVGDLAPPPPPWPLPGTDPTPGIGCGGGVLTGVACRALGPAVEIFWDAADGFDNIDVARDGQLLVRLPGDATSYVDRPAAGGDFSYTVSGRSGGEAAAVEACSVTGLPSNRPPALVLQSPPQGTVVSTPEVLVRGRVTDDSAVVRLIVAGVEVTPEPPPGPGAFSASVPLRPGNNLVRVEAVDDFGRASFQELAVGRAPLLRRGEATDGMTLHFTAGTGYGEIETIVAPFLDRVPALLNDGIRGQEVFRGSVLGVDIRVTADRVEVSGGVEFSLFPSAAGGGRLGISVLLPRVRLFANGRSDYGFLGTDDWTATWTANDVTITGAVAFEPDAGGGALEVASDGFTVSIGSSDVDVNGFLDPFGIFDGLLNFLADLFRDQIEAQVKAAVEETVDEQLLPVLADAFGGLNLDLDLGAVALDTLFDDVLESEHGLSFLLDTLWQGAERDPAFPLYPGSNARFAPFPAFPLAAPAVHPVDVVLSLSSDSLNQAFAELVATGVLASDIELADGVAPIPLTVGGLGLFVDDRLLDLPGLSAETAVGLRLEARAPPEILLGEGGVGRFLLGEGMEWRYFKGSSEPPPGWTGRDFDDEDWDAGPSGFGYSSNPAELVSVRTTLDDMAAGSYTSLYARGQFEVEAPDDLQGLVLRVLYDDGFVAYVNGREVGRFNVAGVAGTPVAYDAPAEAAIEPSRVEIDLAPWIDVIEPGPNVVAIHGINAAATSSDFVLLAEVVEASPLPPGTLSAVPAQILLPDLLVSFIADAGDGIELFAYSLSVRLQTAIVLRVGEGGAPLLEFVLEHRDGPDPDDFPDAVIGGIAGVEIEVAREAVDVDDGSLVEFAEVLLGVFGSLLGEALAAFELPAVPLPELVFDLDGDGAADVRLAIVDATFSVVETDGDGLADWLCILSDLRSEAP